MPENPLETRFEEPGTLKPPGLIGRLVRLALGIILLYAVFVILQNFGAAIRLGIPLTPWNIVIGLILFSVLPYVVNIGWSLNTKRWPQIIVILLSVILGCIDYYTQGVIYGPLLKLFTLAWIFYVELHLGLSFFLAAVLATPGCEMRAIPHLWTIITGNKTREHYCPGFLDGLDKWERGERKSE